MKVSDIQTVGVIGAGTMGAQIAMVCALAGYEVVLNDIEEASLIKAKESLQYHMNRRIHKGKLTQEEVNIAFSKMYFTSYLLEKGELGRKSGKGFYQYS